METKLTLKQDKKAIPKTSNCVREIKGVAKLKKGFNYKKGYAGYLVQKYK